MTTGQCPTCDAARSARAAISRHEDSQDGRLKLLETRVFHCETCGSFLRAETVEIMSANPAG